MTKYYSYLRWSADPLLQTPALVLSARALAKATVHPEVVSALEAFDDRLAYRTYLVGHDIGAADFVLWAALKSEHLILVTELGDLTYSPSQPQGDRPV